ncbi:MAG: ABC transporter ATP-binding protein [Pseudomonadota bacterium]
MLLDINKVSKTYSGAPRPVLDGVDLHVQAGETLALTGESGSGKSTLLHLVGALDSFDSGEIRINGTPLSGLDDRDRAALRRETVAVVFQQFNLMPALTVDQNLAFHARLAGRLDPVWVDTIRNRLGLDGLGARYPEALSGGQQQRVAIGRALAVRPDLLLADEPTGNLDEATADDVLNLMQDLVAETGSALFFVTHSPGIAARLSRRVHLQAGHLT